VRDRFRAALLEATPYCLRLRGDGCHTVLDLVKYNVPELNLPPALQVTIEPHRPWSRVFASIKTPWL
jgi:hypothetical protein